MHFINFTTLIPRMIFLWRNRMRGGIEVICCICTCCGIVLVVLPCRLAILGPKYRSRHLPIDDSMYSWSSSVYLWHKWVLWWWRQCNFGIFLLIWHAEFDAGCSFLYLQQLCRLWSKLSPPFLSCCSNTVLVRRVKTSSGSHLFSTWWKKFLGDCHRSHGSV